MSASNDLDRSTAAAAVGAGLGERVLDGTADVAPVDVPGLGGAIVWRVRDDRSDHPIAAYVGRWPDGSVRVLNDDPDAFLALARATGVDLPDPETALGYVRAFLETTRGPSVIVRVVSHPGEIRWRPGSDDEERRRQAFEADPPIVPPRAVATADGFHVELCLVVDQRVQLNTFAVTRDGDITAAYRVLAEDLPMPIAR
jgi:hypothetical protein